MRTPRLFPRLVLVLSLLASLAAQTASPDAAAATKVKAPKVYVIGASVSGGFEDGPLTGATENGDSVPLQTVLKAWLRPIGGRVASFPPLAMQAMFTDPDGIGDKQIAAAIKAKADVTVGIDFPFWFGYGAVAGADEKQGRLQKLETGLSLLDKLDGELILGDFPDMTGAAARMLSPSWVPKPATLAALNQRLAEWVQQHQGKPGQHGPRVYLFPLAAQVKIMKHEGTTMQLRDGALRCPPKALLQGDALHANRLGMAWLGFELQQFVRRELAADAVLRQPELSLDDFVAAIGAEASVEELRAAPTAPGTGK